MATMGLFWPMHWLKVFESILRNGRLYKNNNKKKSEFPGSFESLEEVPVLSLHPYWKRSWTHEIARFPSRGMRLWFPLPALSTVSLSALEIGTSDQGVSGE